MVAVTSCTTAANPTAGASSSDQQPAVGPVLPVVPTEINPGPARTPPASLTPIPAVGTVEVEPGPFTDRLEVRDLVLQSGDRPAITASLRNAVDVSEFIVLELRADFYDAQGSYLGFGTATYADDEFASTGAAPLTHGTGKHGEAFEVTVSSDTPLTGASSAILTVPQLVNA
jgi:hypothetical protein